MIYRVKQFVKQVRLIICFNCGKFNHKADECRIKSAKCYKCSGDHKPSECQATRENKQYKCINCTENHPASYGGCTFFKEKLKTLQAKRNNSVRERK